MRFNPKSLGSEDGASAVEFALISIVLVLFLTGIMQFGFTFFQYLEVVHSAREGVRWASLGTDPGNVGDSASVRGRVAAAAPGLEPSLDDSDIAISIQMVDGQAAITVSVSYESPVFMPLIGEIVGGNSFPLNSSATQRMEVAP